MGQNSEILTSSSEESNIGHDARCDSTDSMNFIDDNFKQQERHSQVNEETVDNVEAPIGEIIDEYIEDDYRNGLNTE